MLRHDLDEVQRKCRIVRCQFTLFTQGRAVLKEQVEEFVVVAAVNEAEANHPV